MSKTEIQYHGQGSKIFPIFFVLQCESKNFTPSIFFSTVENFYAKFHTPIVRSYIYGELQNFIQLCLNLTKLCHIKRNNLVNFHFSLEF